MPLYGDQFSAFPYNQRSVWDNDYRLAGPLKLITPATQLPVSVLEAKKYCRLDNTEELSTIWRAIKSATRYCERNIPGGRQLMTATWQLLMRDFWYAPFKVPKPPLQSATLQYYDSSDTLQTVDPTIYEFRTYDQQPGELELKPFQVWPARGFGWSPFSSGRTYPVVLNFVAGYASQALVPDTVKEAILILVNNRFQNREPTIEGKVSDEIAYSVASLLNSEGYGNYA